MIRSAFTSCASLAVALIAVATLGCRGASTEDVAAAPDAGVDTADANAAACPPCLHDADCKGGVCAQFGGDSYCAPACPTGSECTSDRTCTSAPDFAGKQVSVCIPKGDVCGPESAVPDAGPSADATADASDGGLCGTLAPPDLTSVCSSCGTHTCQPNGCYGGWWCDTATSRCHAPPAGCGAPAGDGGPPSSTGVPYVGGDAPSGSITKDGGGVSRLYFAIVGDTRPASDNDTASYPTPIITKIYQQMAALKPAPSFAVATGDYMFASPGSGQSAPQLDLYLGARKAFDSPLFPTMGNHECTGMTASNCGVGMKDGETSNYTDYLAKMLAPIGQTKPWYVIHVKATDGSWTAKFVFVAGNAWTPEQSTWLDAAMAEATTYTFVVRHEPAAATTAPGVAPSEAIMAKYPYTLAIVGHTHTYGHRNKQVIIGNGGAPLTSSGNYGFGMISQRADGAVAIDVIDYQTGLADSSFHFALNADGTPAP